MTKIFPKSRVCVIDCHSAFESGLKRDLTFCSQNNITINSNDGKKLILRFCLNTIEKSYTTIKSQYPKVLCISKRSIPKKMEHFINDHFDQMMSRLPFPYCGKYDLDSPDLEMAAENSLRREKPQKKFQDFLTKVKFK